MLYGHEKTVSVLSNAIEGNRVSHAYLFYGMKGVGKRTVAMIFARTLNCEKHLTSPCEQCTSCRKALHGNHPDIITVEAEGQFIRVKDIRDIQHQMTFKPFDGGRRIVVIVDADKMNIESANALLKTLEEPSAANTLILITSRPHFLPMTILSRCQHLRFNPLPMATIASCLKEQHSMDAGQADFLAASSGGSIGRAIEMSKGAYLTLRDELIDKLGKNRANDPLRMLSFAGGFGKDKQGVLKKLDIMRGFYRDIMVYKETGDEKLLLNRDCLETINDMALRLTGTGILENIKVVEQTYRAVEQNANRSLVLEAMAMKLT